MSLRDYEMDIDLSYKKGIRESKIANNAFRDYDVIYEDSNSPQENEDLIQARIENLKESYPEIFAFFNNLTK